MSMRFQVGDFLAGEGLEDEAVPDKDVGCCDDKC